MHSVQLFFTLLVGSRGRSSLEEVQTAPPGAAAAASGKPSGQLSTGPEQPQWCARARSVSVPPTSP